MSRASTGIKRPSAINQTRSRAGWIVALLLLLAACCSERAMAGRTENGQWACKDPTAVITWNEDYCCPTPDLLLEMNPRGTGPRCTRCLLTQHRCYDVQGGGCCNENDYCLSSPTGVLLCSSTPDLFGALSNRSSPDIRLDGLPSDRYTAGFWDSHTGDFIIFMARFLVTILVLALLLCCLRVCAWPCKATEQQRAEASGRVAPLASPAVAVASRTAAPTPLELSVASNNRSGRVAPDSQTAYPDLNRSLLEPASASDSAAAHDAAPEPV